MTTKRRAAIIADSLKVQTIGLSNTLVGFDMLTGTDQILAVWPASANIVPDELLADKKALARALGFNLIAPPQIAPSASTDEESLLVLQMAIWLIIAVFIGLKELIK